MQALPSRNGACGRCKEGGKVNWTSTTVPLWQIDCENYRKVGGPFQLKDVTTAEHHQFVKLFCARYDYTFTMAADTAIFNPPTWRPPNEREKAN